VSTRWMRNAYQEASIHAATRPPSGSRPVRITAGALLDRWLADAVALTVLPRTAASYRYISRVHLRPALGHVLLGALTAQDVQTFLNQKAAAGLAPCTVGYLRGVLRQALGYAERMDLVGRNVARLARPPRVPRRPVSPLTLEEARAFRAAIAGDRLEALYLVAIGCGLREGEILGLRWPDVDLERRTLTVRAALARVDGALCLVEPKSATARRTVPLPPTTRGPRVS
jgi:integrase